MTKERLKSYQTNKRIYEKLCEEIDSLRAQLSDLSITSSQVQSSGEEFPYLPGHVPVEVVDPEASDAINARIADKEKQRSSIREELCAVEIYIEAIDDPGERQIFEWLFLDGMTQEELGDVLHYSQGRISQIINDRMKEEEDGRSDGT